jgi:plastocyanin
MQSVSLTAEDFRFVPNLVRVTASFPLTLTVYNAGREVHDFDSPVLLYAGPRSSSEGTSKSHRPGIVLKPGKSVQLVMSPPPGTYLYMCRRKGHANMTGTLIVE